MDVVVVEEVVVGVALRVLVQVKASRHGKDSKLQLNLPSKSMNL